MSFIKLAIINASSVVTDAQVQQYVTAQQKQINDHFAKSWGITADLTFIPKGQNPPAADWWLAILDNSDVANALGYHDYTTTGLPIGKAFAKTDIDHGLSWTVTASHEVLEMLADPNIVRAVENYKTRLTSYFYALEVGDPVESDNYAYLIDGVKLTDFVTPFYFESQWSKGKQQFDYQNKVTLPFQILPGGYLSVFIPKRGWIQQENFDTFQPDEVEKLKQLAIAPTGSRRERRSRKYNDGHDALKFSTVPTS